MCQILYRDVSRSVGLLYHLTHAAAHHSKVQLKLRANEGIQTLFMIFIRYGINYDFLPQVMNIVRHSQFHPIICSARQI